MSFELLKFIETHLKEGFSQTRFRQPDAKPGEYAPVQFHIGALMPKRKNNSPDYQAQSEYPYIVNRQVGVDDSPGEMIITVKTLVGIYTDGDPAHGDEELFNMAARIRRLFLEARILGNRYELVHPLKSAFGDQGDDHRQPHPYHVGAIVSQWRTAPIEPLLSVEEETRIYGSGL